MATKEKKKAQGLDGLNGILSGQLDSLKKMQAQVEQTVANLPKLNALYSKPFKGGERVSVTGMRAVILEFRTQEEAQAYYDAIDKEDRL